MDIGSTAIGYRGPDDLLPGFMVIWARMFYFATTRLNLVVLAGNMQSHEGNRSLVSMASGVTLKVLLGNDIYSLSLINLSFLLITGNDWMDVI